MGWTWSGCYQSDSPQKHWYNAVSQRSSSAQLGLITPPVSTEQGPEQDGWIISDEPRVHFKLNISLAAVQITLWWRCHRFYFGNEANRQRSFSELSFQLWGAFTRNDQEDRPRRDVSLECNGLIKTSACHLSIISIKHTQQEKKTRVKQSFHLYKVNNGGGFLKQQPAGK